MGTLGGDARGAAARVPRAAPPGRRCLSSRDALTTAQAPAVPTKASFQGVLAGRLVRLLLLRGARALASLLL